MANPVKKASKKASKKAAKKVARAAPAPAAPVAAKKASKKAAKKAPRAAAAVPPQAPAARAAAPAAKKSIKKASKKATAKKATRAAPVLGVDPGSVKFPPTHEEFDVLQNRVATLEQTVANNHQGITDLVTVMAEIKTEMARIDATKAGAEPATKEPVFDDETAAALEQLQISSIDDVKGPMIATWGLAQCRTYIELLGYTTPTDVKGVAAWRVLADQCRLECQAKPTEEQAADEAAPLAAAAGDVVEGPNGERATVYEDPFNEDTGIQDQDVIYISQGEDGVEWWRAVVDGYYQDEDQLWYLYLNLVDAEGSAITDDAGQPCTASLYNPGSTQVAENSPFVIGKEAA